MTQAKNTEYATTIAWEWLDGTKWKLKRHTFAGNVKIDRVVKEMQQQPNLRNITLIGKEPK